MQDSKKAIWSWALYDWANSAFATTVMAGFFPLFFKAYWADPADPLRSTFYLGMANSVASLIVAGLAPFLGTVADRGAVKKRFLAIFVGLGVVTCAGLYAVPQGDWKLAVGLFMLGTIGFMGANIFYDSLLPAVASDKKVDFVSSLGYSLGYMGGGVLFALNVGMFLKPGFFGIPDQSTAIRLSFLLVAFWWAIFTLPLWFSVPEPHYAKPLPVAKAFTQGWPELKKTWREIRRYKVVVVFLVAYWLYIDGVDTIVRMAVDYGKSLGFGSQSLIKALLLTQVIGFPSALAFGYLASRAGAKRMVMAAIGAYGLITLLAFFMETEKHFYILAAMIGLFQGGIQALSRSMFTQIIPRDKAAQFFGFYNMLGKFAAVIGPALMGTVTLVTGNARIGILSLLILFISGGWLLSRVDFEEGRRAAQGKS